MGAAGGRVGQRVGERVQLNLFPSSFHFYTVLLTVGFSVKVSFKPTDCLQMGKNYNLHPNFCSSK